jgi:hypothetical protein
MCTTEELLDKKKSSGSCLDNREYDRRDHVAPSIRKKLAIASPTSSGRWVGIVRSRSQTMEFNFSLVALGTVIK